MIMVRMWGLAWYDAYTTTHAALHNNSMCGGVVTVVRLVSIGV